MLFNIWQHSKATMTELLDLPFKELELMEEIAVKMTKDQNDQVK